MRFWGKKEEPVDPEAVKASSIAEVRRLGGRTIDHLPLTDVTVARTGEELARRALVLNALVGLAYEAPPLLLRDWLATNGLSSTLSPMEATVLRKLPEDLSEEDVNNAGWGMEALYALLWASGFAETIGIEDAVSMDHLAALPNVGRGQDAREFTRGVRLRPYAELFAMRDLYYRAHWYARDAGLKNEDPGSFSIDSIMERRKALEWLLDETQEWDEVEMST